MRIDSAFNSGVTGLQRADLVADKASGQIARLNTPGGDQVQVTDELVSLKVAEQQAAASAKVVQSASEVMGTLIDIRV